MGPADVPVASSVCQSRKDVPPFSVSIGFVVALSVSKITLLNPAMLPAVFALLTVSLFPVPLVDPAVMLPATVVPSTLTLLSFVTVPCPPRTLPAMYTEPRLIVLSEAAPVDTPPVTFVTLPLLTLTVFFVASPMDSPPTTFVAVPPATLTVLPVALPPAEVV